jgi:hypothetical protein
MKKSYILSNDKSVRQETTHRPRDIDGGGRTLHGSLAVKELSYLNSDNSSLLASAE